MAIAADGGSFLWLWTGGGIVAGHACQLFGRQSSPSLWGGGWRFFGGDGVGRLSEPICGGEGRSRRSASPTANCLCFSGTDDGSPQRHHSLSAVCPICDRWSLLDCLVFGNYHAGKLGRHGVASDHSPLRAR